MSSLVVISMLQAEKKLINYFRSANALSAEKAILFDQTEYQKSGSSYLQHKINPSKVPYLKPAGDGKYFLDEQVLNTIQEKSKKTVWGILIACVFLLIISLTLRVFLG